MEKGTEEGKKGLIKGPKKNKKKEEKKSGSKKKER